jgi:hypothetical protein
VAPWLDVDRYRGGTDTTMPAHFVQP